MATKQQFILPNWAHYVSHWASSLSIFFSMRDNIAIIFLQSIYAHTDTKKKSNCYRPFAFYCQINGFLRCVIMQCFQILTLWQ